ncbi:MAG: cation transporter [Oceanospirillaceae bacterium]|nr:cation transporter [Oceanospirillaceae bacterium]
MADHRHSHNHNHDSQSVLLSALVLTALFAGVEVLAGWWANSLALIGDAGHMITDSLSLGIGALAAWMSRKPPSTKHSYGLARAETVGALINILFMLALIGFLAVEAIDRLTHPAPVKGEAVMVVAGLGLAINLAVAWMLHRGEQNLNVRGAMLHVMGDLLGSVAALVAGGVIFWTGWNPIDPILSILIAALILASSLRLLRDILHVIMEGVPFDIELDAVGQAMADCQGVTHVHDLHVWALDSGTYAISAHVVVDCMEAWDTYRAALECLLADSFGIKHTTLQPESGQNFDRACADGACGKDYTPGSY